MTPKDIREWAIYQIFMLDEQIEKSLKASDGANDVAYLEGQIEGLQMVVRQIKKVSA